MFVAGKPQNFVRRKPKKRTNVAELSRYFGVHRRTMYEWIAENPVDLYDIKSVFQFVVRASLGQLTVACSGPRRKKAVNE